MAQTNLTIRLDSNDKKTFSDICESIGLSVSAAYNVFTKAVIRTRRIPFELEANDDSFYSKENIKYVNELDEEKDFTQAIIFVSDFHSPKEAIGAWEEDKKYEDWNWILARTDGGEWQLLTWGY